jgi:hypothetical protein
MIKPDKRTKIKSKLKKIARIGLKVFIVGTVIYTAGSSGVVFAVVRALERGGR